MAYLFSRTTPSILLLLALAIPTTLVQAVLPTGFNMTIPQYGYQGVIPSSVVLPPACAAAYRAPIECEVQLLVPPNNPAKGQTLNTVCTRACAASLLAYERKVKAECSPEKGVVLETLGLRGSWMEFLVSGRAGVGVYWKHCLRDLVTKDVCVISQADYELAWNAATADTPEEGAVRAFCSNNCLTQTIVLNVGTQDNLNELSRMCGSQVNIAGMPFIPHMVFAGLIRLADTATLQEGETVDLNDPTPLIPPEGQIVGNTATTIASGRTPFLLLLVTIVVMVTGA